VAYFNTLFKYLSEKPDKTGKKLKIPESDRDLNPVSSKTRYRGAKMAQFDEK
jgi:hypothetical protein